MTTPIRASDEPALPGLLLLGIWLALISGLIEGGYRMVQVFLLHKVILMPLHVVWMAPVADLIWVGVPAVALAVLHRVWPRVVTRGLAAAVLAAIAALPLVLLITAMHKIVALFLAIAIGIQAGRLMVRHPVGTRRLVRRTVIPVAVVILLAGVSIPLTRSMRERRAVATLPAAQPDAVNVLLIIWDTVRGQSLSVYGYERPTTPFLEQFATEGTRFDRAMSTAPWTLPSHAAMFTGHRPRDVMIDVYHPIVDTLPTLAEALARHGYRTGGFVANTSYTTREHGLDQGFQRYQDYLVDFGTLIKCSRLGAVIMDQDLPRRLLGYWNDLDRKNAAQVNGEFLHWVDGRGDRPFFAFLNYYDAHRPYIAVEPYRSQFVRDSSGRFRPRLEHLNFKQASKDEIEWTHDNYDAAIAYQDAQVRMLLDSLEARGVLDNTLVIVASDHGEHFGDHNRLGHMNSLYRQLLQVPLLMRLPGRVPAGYVVTTPVTLADLPRTILDLAGVADTGGIPGTSLARFWNGADPDTPVADDVVLSEIGTRKGRGPFSFFAHGYHYIQWWGQARDEQMYAVAGDPWELHDLSERPELADTLRLFEDLTYRLMGPHALDPLDQPDDDDADANLRQ